MLKKYVVLLLVFLFCNTLQAQELSPSSALKSYVDRPEEKYGWNFVNAKRAQDYTISNVLLTSQVWQGFTWRHQLTIIIPHERVYRGALLFVTGGSNHDEQPKWQDKPDKTLEGLIAVSLKNKAVVAQIRQVPNQPFYGGLTEDALISYTLHNFKKDKDYTWPLLFPMVKSVVKAMDAIQEFADKEFSLSVTKFTISGASKRGWTSWLTSAINDERVEAIGPMVIDILNMPKSLQYQIDTWGEYSVEIEDYVKLGIPQSAATSDGQAITTMIDPYSYKSTMTVPKMIFMGTNDPYWVVDNIKNYYKDIPARNMLHYVPNAGHNLGGGEQALNSLSSFWAYTLQKKPYPDCQWELKQKRKEAVLKITATPENLVGVTLWSATSPDRDLRNDQWVSKDLGLPADWSKTNVFETKVKLPSSGYQAFYVDLRYKDPNGQEFTTSTRMYLSDSKKVFID